MNRIHLTYISHVKVKDLASLVHCTDQSLKTNTCKLIHVRLTAETGYVAPWSYDFLLLDYRGSFLSLIRCSVFRCLILGTIDNPIHIQFLFC